uniref:COMM domain-containing protein 3 n=1 Tax=Pediculus humanus subsp. corporis TaxID=121224 RepID=A0A1S4N1J2_PEDHC
MEFSDDVLQGLTYLASGNYLTDDNYKKIVDSCLGLLGGEQNIERVSSICPEKSDIVKESYASLMTLTLEFIRHDGEDDLKNFLIKHNFKSSRIDQYMKSFNFYKNSIIDCLNNCHSDWPNIIDADWSLEYIVKSNACNHVGEFLYYIVLTTEKDGKIDYVRFACDLHQLQDLSTKLKEIVCHIEKISSYS